LEEGDFLSVLAGRFSCHAKVCVTFLLATGAYNAWLHLPAWSSFVSTRYGQTLLSKLFLLLPLLAAAFVNLHWIMPALASADVPLRTRIAARRLVALVRAEVMLGGLILVAAAALTHLPPAAAVSPGAPRTQSKSSGAFEVDLEMTPQRVGSNRASARLRAADGSAILSPIRVTFYFRMLDMNMGLQTIPGQSAADGSYSGDVFLSMAGRWQVSVEISPPQGDTFVTEFQFLAAPEERSIQ
jgi:hypothetical protein